jgi:hypothetical protein
MLAEQLDVQVSPLDADIVLTSDPDFVADGGPIVAEYLVESTQPNPEEDVEVLFQASSDVTARLVVQAPGE